MNTAEGQVQHELENRILNQILNNPPVIKPIGKEFEKKSFSNLIASEYHYGETEGAADINFGNKGDDIDLPIRAVADGEIASIGYDSSGSGVTIMVITHTMADKSTWQSVYMHMPISKTTVIVDGKEIEAWEMRNSKGEVIATLKAKDKVTGSQIIAAVGHEGSGIGNDHLHFEAHTAGWRSSRAINLDGVLSKLRITTKTEGGHIVTFDTGLQEWVTNDAVVADIVKVIDVAADPEHNIKEQAHGEVVMRAWEEGKATDKMTEVAWDTDLNGWFQWDAINKVKVKNSDNKILKWNSISRTFLPQ
jgi:murein DD-endopeptidase MepM/ murein hydrolase activator NlpD